MSNTSFPWELWQRDNVVLSYISIRVSRSDLLLPELGIYPETICHGSQSGSLSLLPLQILTLKDKLLLT